MKHIDADRLKAKIERKKAQYSDWAEEEWDDDREYNHGAFGAFKTVMLIIDSLQQEQTSLPDNLEEAARHVYESWMGGTMDDVRRDMVELGKVLNVRKEESK